MPGKSERADLEPVAESRNRADFALTVVLELHALVADSAPQEQFQPERIVHELHQVPAQVAILAGAAADRTRFHVGVIRVAVFDLVVNAGGESIERAFQVAGVQRHLVRAGWPRARSSSSACETRARAAAPGRCDPPMAEDARCVLRSRSLPDCRTAGSTRAGASSREDRRSPASRHPGATGPVPCGRGTTRSGNAASCGRTPSSAGAGSRRSMPGTPAATVAR